MKETEKLKLKLPEENDYYNVNDINGNFEILDETTVTQSDFGEFKDGVSEVIGSMEGITTDIDEKMNEFRTEFTGLKEAVVNDTTAKFNELDAKLFKEIHSYIDTVTTKNADGSITEVSSIGTIVTVKNSDGSYIETLTKPDGTVITKTTTKIDNQILEVIS